MPIERPMEGVRVPRQARGVQTRPQGFGAGSAVARLDPRRKHGQTGPVTALRDLWRRFRPTSRADVVRVLVCVAARAASRGGLLVPRARRPSTRAGDGAGAGGPRWRSVRCRSAATRRRCSARSTPRAPSRREWVARKVAGQRSRGRRARAHAARSSARASTASASPRSSRSSAIRRSAASPRARGGVARRRRRASRSRVPLPVDDRRRARARGRWSR